MISSKSLLQIIKGSVIDKYLATSAAMYEADISSDFKGTYAVWKLTNWNGK